MKKFFIIILLLQFSQEVISQGKNRNKNTNNHQEQAVFKTEIPDQLYNIILGRPTQNSVAVSLYSTKYLEFQIIYGLEKNKLNQKTKFFKADKKQTLFVVLENLKTFSNYYYQLVYKTSSDTDSQYSEINNFQTARKLGDSFVFTIQADSHLDENASTSMYEQTLKNMLADAPDFLVDLGDTWMTDKYKTDYKESYQQYLAQRYYFGLLGKTASVFLTLGNHDGESGKQLQKKQDNMGLWATQVRREFYPNPYPNSFYSGNTTKEDGKYFIENYYAWQWGDALCIVLDPFRFTSDNKSPWQRTLGNNQYQWLKTTLEKSTAKFKFIFIHNLVGGIDLKGISRGGAEAVKFYEWGGFDTLGTNGFKQNRPDWELPIHDLLKKNQVDIVFHGHDHFFAKQDLDGIIYQLLPQPGAMRYGNINSAEEYGYVNGTILNAPGYLKVTVKPTKAVIEFIQSSTDNKHINKEVLQQYTIQK